MNLALDSQPPIDMPPLHLSALQNESPGRQTFNPTRAELVSALGNQQFELYYQPQVDSSGKNINGYEALLRWNHPQHGLLTPEKFLDAVHNNQMENGFSRWVLEKALCDYPSLLNHTKQPNISVNVTADDLLQLSFCDFVVTRLSEHDIPTKSLTIELTEHLAVTDVDRLASSIQILRLAGVNVSLDDFGTGFNTLELLVKAPFNEIKIERSFISQLCFNQRQHQAVEAIIHLANAMGIHTVAEGVEYQYQFDTLNELGIDAAQGYLFGRPQSLEQLENTGGS